MHVKRLRRDKASLGRTHRMSYFLQTPRLEKECNKQGPTRLHQPLRLSRTFLGDYITVFAAPRREYEKKIFNGNKSTQRKLARQECR